MSERPKVVAFYLPQFHPVPENDAWWGRGFTEWANVVKATPMFDGHEQPHLPADLGYYDLRVPEVRVQQAAMARTHGIDAFCYYHYWFGGRRVLDRVFDEVLRSGTPDLPFCLCWANENWTRAWDASEQEVLLAQDHGPAEREEHVRYLVDAFADPRYLRVDGRPLFAIYRVQQLPGADEFLARLRAVSMERGAGDPYVVKFDTHGNFEDPAGYHCDAAAQFFPHGADVRVPRARVDAAHPEDHLWRYADVVETYLAEPAPAWTRHECVTPGWDNTARRGVGRSHLIIERTPELYERWLRAACERADARGGGPGRGVVFVNAWNEWAEGAHLEPDERHGRAYLRAHARAVLGAEPEDLPLEALGAAETVLVGPRFADLYVDLYDRCVKLQRRLTASEAMAQRLRDGGAVGEQLRAAAETITKLRAQVAALEARVAELEDGS